MGTQWPQLSPGHFQGTTLAQPPWPSLASGRHHPPQAPSQLPPPTRPQLWLCGHFCEQIRLTVTIISTKSLKARGPIGPIPLALDTETLRSSWEEIFPKAHSKYSKSSSYLLQGLVASYRKSSLITHTPPPCPLPPPRASLATPLFPHYLARSKSVHLEVDYLINSFCTEFRTHLYTEYEPLLISQSPV